MNTLTTTITNCVCVRSNLRETRVALEDQPKMIHAKREFYRHTDM